MTKYRTAAYCKQHEHVYALDEGCVWCNSSDSEPTPQPQAMEEHRSTLADLSELEWRQPTRGQQWQDGTQILAAVRVLDSRTKREYWEYAVVRIEADEGHFALTCNGEPWGWEHDSINRFVVLDGNVFDT